MLSSVLMKRIGSGRSSPGSRWRRFTILIASRKSDRSFIGAFLPFIHFDALLLGPANFELRITMYWTSLERVVNSVKILF